MSLKLTKRNEEVRQLFIMGVRPSLIAQRYGISRQRVYVICAGCQPVVSIETDQEPRKVAEVLGVPVVPA